MGLLSEALSREFESHLEVCPSCRAELSRRETIQHDDNSEMSPDHLFKKEFIPEPSKKYWQELPTRIMARLPHEAPSQGAVARMVALLARIMSSRGLAWKLAGSLAVVCIAFFIGRGIYLSRPPFSVKGEHASSIRPQNELAAVITPESRESEPEGSGEGQRPGMTQAEGIIPSRPAAPSSEVMTMAEGVKDRPAGKPTTEELPKEVQRVAVSAPAKEVVSEELKARMIVTASDRGMTKSSGNAAKIPSALGTEANIDAQIAVNNEQAKSGLLPYVYMTLLSQEEFEKCQNEVAALESTIAGGDTSEVGRARVLLGRFYFTLAVTDTTAASYQKALEYWLAHQEVLSDSIGAEQAMGVVDYLKLSIR